MVEVVLRWLRMVEVREVAAVVRLCLLMEAWVEEAVDHRLLSHAVEAWEVEQERCVVHLVAMEVVRAVQLRRVTSAEVAEEAYLQPQHSAHGSSNL